MLTVKKAALIYEEAPGTDLPAKGQADGFKAAGIDIKVVDMVLKIKAQMYLLEAANARHEHEVAVWDDVKLPDGKILAPGVVTDSTPIIEHPELVAMRIEAFATRVGRENVVASTDCGLGLRLHPSLAWKKLNVLTEGARIASDRLW